MTEQQQAAIFSSNLKRYMDELGVTQKEVAKAIGVSPQAFNFWVAGRNLPRMDKIQKLASYFRVKKSDLIESSSGYELKQGEYKMKQKETELLELFREVSPEAQQAILDLLKTFNKQQ